MGASSRLEKIFLKFLQVCCVDIKCYELDVFGSFRLKLSVHIFASSEFSFLDTIDFWISQAATTAQQISVQEHVVVTGPLLQM